MRMFFKDLPEGEAFEFADTYKHGMCIGPWVKLSARKYRYKDDNTRSHLAVGSTMALIVPERPQGMACHFPEKDSE